jgi:hypothetical protein
MLLAPSENARIIIIVVDMHAPCSVTAVADESLLAQKSTEESAIILA